jgi:hypothetical protein
VPRIALGTVALLALLSALLAGTNGTSAAPPAGGRGDVDAAVVRPLPAARVAICTRAKARAGLCRIRPSSAAPRLRQPPPLPPCPAGQMRAGVRCVGPSPLPPVRPVPEIGRCLGGTWMGSGCLCPGGRVPQQLGRNFYSCGTPGDCPGGGRRIGTQCIPR